MNNNFSFLDKKKEEKSSQIQLQLELEIESYPQIEGKEEDQIIEIQIT